MSRGVKKTARARWDAWTRSRRHSPNTAQRPKIIIDAGTGAYNEVGADGVSTPLPKATITLNDCLACSGCVTSAEAVLIAAQSADELRSGLAKRLDAQNDDVRLVVASVSPQARASLAAHYGVPVVEMHERLVGALRQLGVDLVLDLSLSRQLALLASALEFERALEQESTPLPLLASECPGWVCYAEKAHAGVALPHLSRVRSAQQIMAELVKSHVSRCADVARSQVLHFSVAPCFDKKLEASRDDFKTDDGTSDCDIVLAANELPPLLDAAAESALPSGHVRRGACGSETCICAYDGVFQAERGEVEGGGGSGGYAQYVYERLAARDGAVCVPFAPAKRRGGDVREASVKLPPSPSSSSGRVVRLAVMNGFRNVTNLVRGLKKAAGDGGGAAARRRKYDYIEVMACPRGCLNGGGQVRETRETTTTTTTTEAPAGPATGGVVVSRKEALAMLQTVTALYDGAQRRAIAPHEDTAVERLVASKSTTSLMADDDGVVQELVNFDAVPPRLLTEFHDRSDSEVDALAIKW